MTPMIDTHCTHCTALYLLDRVRWELVQEEMRVIKALEKQPSDALDVRLGEIHELLNQIGAQSAESRARRILFGLGTYSTAACCLALAYDTPPPLSLCY